MFDNNDNIYVFIFVYLSTRFYKILMRVVCFERLRMYTYGFFGNFGILDHETMINVYIYIFIEKCNTMDWRRLHITIYIPINRYLMPEMTDDLITISHYKS